MKCIDAKLMSNGINIFKKIDCPEGLEIVYNKIISEYLRVKD